MTPRRSFTVALLVTLAAIVAGQAPDAADLVLVNGRVFTADDRTPWAEAVAIRGGRIVDVGTSTTIRPRAGASGRVIDVGGRVVIPGINDAHTHVGARPPGAVLKLGDDPTLDEVVAAIRTTATSSAPGQWIGNNILN